jgi:ABC-type phosphate/phosphonate transport system permease subunit
VKPQLHAFGVDDIGRLLLPSHTFGVDEGSCSKPGSFQASATGQLLASAEAIAGVFALALHAAGFLGKFYAEDIENSDPKPQEALTAIGAGRLKVLRYAILPQVLPQYIAYTLYILDRNMRMATVVGLVGAGGIGQELKGRYDLYNYSHVCTILIAVFILVFALDQLSSRLRRLCL